MQDILATVISSPTIIKEFIVSSTLIFLISFFLISMLAKAFVDRSKFIIRFITWICLLGTMGYMTNKEANLRS